ncbi:MAG: hypothetical protein O3A84_06850 [Proteobacteria bacterium]|nr:hypothetical protein [Pseudomonadota bacterium]
MKFLAFNLVVVAALVYLVAGEKGGAVSTHAVKAVTEVNQFARDAVTAGKELMSPPVVVAAKQLQDLAPAPAPVPRLPVTQAELTPPPAVPSLSPEVKKRRDEVLSTGPVAIAQPKPAPVRAVVVNDDRRQQLLKLAEQMELFHVEAVSR